MVNKQKLNSNEMLRPEMYLKFTDFHISFGVKFKYIFIRILYYLNLQSETFHHDYFKLCKIWAFQTYVGTLWWTKYINIMSMIYL